MRNIEKVVFDAVMKYLERRVSSERGDIMCVKFKTVARYIMLQYKVSVTPQRLRHLVDRILGQYAISQKDGIKCFKVRDIHQLLNSAHHVAPTV